MDWTTGLRPISSPLPFITYPHQYQSYNIQVQHYQIVIIILSTFSLCPILRLK